MNRAFPILTRALLILGVAMPAFIEQPRAAFAADGAIPTVQLPVANSPLVTLRVQFRAGAVDDPAGKKGITQLTAAMMTGGGTKKHAYEEMVALLYPMASSVDFTVEKEVTTFSGTTHVDNLEKYLDLFLQTLLEPRFDARDFERLRESQVNYLEKGLRGANDEELGKQSLAVTMYAGHAYGVPNEGRVADLQSVTLEDVKAHYARVFTRANVTVGVAAAKPAPLADRVTKALGRLPAAAPARAANGATTPIEGIEVLAVEKDCLATAISMGFPITVTRSHPDFTALLVANSFLGEHRTFNGRLMIRMREVRGLNYGDYSYIEHFVQEGGSTFPLANIPRSEQYFSIWIRPVQHAQRHFAMRLALWELEKLVRDGMTAQEFEDTRKFLKNYSRLWAQDQDRRLGYLMDSRYYGIDDYLANLPAKLDALTLEQVSAAIRAHLRADRLRVAVVTKGAEAFLHDLLNNTPSPMTYDAGGIPADVIAEDGTIATYRLNVNRAASKVVPVAEMFR